MVKIKKKTMQKTVIVEYAFKKKTVFILRKNKLYKKVCNSMKKIIKNIKKNTLMLESR